MINDNILALNEYVRSKEGYLFKVVKLTTRPGRESNIEDHREFVGQANMIYFGYVGREGGFILELSIGCYMHTSVITDAKKRSPSLWIVTTLNSQYSLKLCGRIRKEEEGYSYG